MRQFSIHPSALSESNDIGPDTRVEAFTYIAHKVRVGQNCVIGPHVFIGKDAVIGDRVIIRGSAQICAGTIIEDEVSIAAHATFLSDRNSHSWNVTDNPIVLRRGCKIGANATLCAGVTIGEYGVVGAGAVVMRSVQPHAIVAGNPATVVAFTNTLETPARPAAPSSALVQATESKVRGVKIYELPLIRDPRGNLTVGEFERTLPFVPKRYFMTFDVPSVDLRGEHAHRTCHQFLLCVRGSCAVVVDDGLNREEFLLDRPTVGVHVPPMVWATEYKHSQDSTLLVFASEYYDPADYIRDYQIFLKEAASLWPRYET
jgi:acetyltransferase-like isoleucine patch superfamily enzyme/dTDP-4-dehydrorhamnose 3,5-epimerase-like enzyme